MQTKNIVARLIGLGAVAAVSFALLPGASGAESKEKVSYFKQVRPIFQAQCQGCHQPAKAKGGYVMTDFKKMLAGGDNKDKEPAIVPKKPAASHLLKQITPVNGAAEMPKGKPALTEPEIELIRAWIAQGARDDTPADAVKHYDAEHPPLYQRLPVVTSLDYSPDGSLIAVTGFHEVLLHKADGSGIVARLVGMSERIQSVRFSPDGKSLAVAGGLPARLGEVQIWDVETRKLTLSVPVSYDTVYGASWSPDGTMVAFGCPDNTARAIEVKTGKEVFKLGSHSDWVLDTAFSVKGDHIISVGRDMTAKLTETATQRFVDNITSITPGALKGGLAAVAQVPGEDHVLVGGSDGAPQIYRIHRQSVRVIGDNANLIRKFPDMPGRIFSVCFSRDGKQFAASSSLDNRGQVVIYAAATNAVMSDALKAIAAKTADKRTPDEKGQLEKFHADGFTLESKLDVADSGIYAVAFSPDGKTVAAAGQDGSIRFIKAANGQVAKLVAAAPLTTGKAPLAKNTTATAAGVIAAEVGEKETLPKGAKVVSLEVEPATVKLGSRNDYAQLIVSAKLDSGDTVDVTRLAKLSPPSQLAELTPRGQLYSRRNGSGQLKVSFGGKSVAVPVQVAGVKETYDADFIRDVNPVLSKLGCTAGTCHGSKDGRSGFKLSLRGYDHEMDVRAFTDDLASRRVNCAAPDDSLMLLKAVAEVPHEGGRRTPRDSRYYQIMRAWIAEGAKLNPATPRVTKIEIFPKNPVVQVIGSRQQMRVLATDASGATRDVTAEAFVESGNGDVVKAEGGGLISTLRRGEAPVLARFEGAYAATTVTVMGDRTGFAWQEPMAWGKVDELVAAKWKRMRMLPSDLCSDTDFIRRVYLDLTGLPPGPEDVRKFTADTRETRVKRAEVVDKLIGSEDYVDHWTSKWADLLQVNRKFLGEEGATIFRDWIRAEVAKNTPYDKFVQKIVTATGSNKENPPASYYKVLRTPAETMENTTHLFLATRFSCNKCHDHPFERWTQDQYYQTAAFFAQVELKKDPVSGDRNIGGTAVEGAKPLFEIVSDMPSGDVKHDRTGKVTPPDFPFPAKFEPKAKATRREQLSEWLTSQDNRYFAASYVNRIWGYLMGAGIIEPLDDIRAGNPPTNPELLEWLTQDFIKNGFNVRHLIATICKSRTYQLSLGTNKWNEDDKINYSHALARRLPAEVLFDAVFKVTGSMPNIPGVKPGTRAAQLMDSSQDVASGLLASLGRPPRESACECERSNDIRLGSVMALLSGPTVSGAINDPNNAIAGLVKANADDRQLINELFLRVLNRPVTDKEVKSALNTAGLIEPEHKKLLGTLDAKQKELAPLMNEQDRQRTTAITLAQTTLDTYVKDNAAKVAAAKKAWEDNITASAARLDAYEKSLSEKTGVWEKGLTNVAKATAWHPLKFTELKATTAAKLTQLPDGSVLVSGAAGNADYTLTADTTLTNITGVKIEAIPDLSLPNFGPGRAPDGNFVLTELQFGWSTKAAKDKFMDIGFKEAKADFSQADFAVTNAIDGKVVAGANGWAVSPKTSEPRVAIFQLAKPAVEESGSQIRFQLIQKYADPYTLGRFRISVMTGAQPLDYGYPREVLDALAVAAADRTKAQQETLIAQFRDVDVELRKLAQATVTSKVPLPIDPKLVELQGVLAKANLPVPLDPKLVQLREDVAASTKQLENKRLTGAQDLVWALVNNPSFLFNH